jgi:hypothetical protein
LVGIRSGHDRYRCEWRRPSAHLLDQHGLADAGRADEMQSASATPPKIIQRCIDEREFGLTPDQDRGKRALDSRAHGPDRTTELVSQSHASHDPVRGG